MHSGDAEAMRLAERPDAWRLDWATRAVVAAVFTAMAILSVNGIYQSILQWDQLDTTHKLLMIAARVSNALFLALVAATVLFRLRPVAKAPGLWPRVTALMGTFLCVTLAFLPPADLHPFWTTLSTLLVIAGASLAFVVLRWLGKSFSIMAEARRLVTDGPYALVRHPLYVVEELVAIGIMIQVFSPAAVAIVGAHLVLQLLRIRNEEKVLRSVFPEYAEYAARTPCLIPRRAVWRSSALA